SAPNSTARAAAGPSRDTLALLEGLLQTLAETTHPTEAIRAAVDAAREGVGADAAFWYSRSSKATGTTGPLTPDQAAQFARKLIHAIPTDLEVFRWANPDPPAAGVPTAALVARTARSGGSVVVLTFTPGRRFDAADEGVVRLALKMLVGLRAHAQRATKQLLNGLVHSLTAVIDAKDPYTA